MGDSPFPRRSLGASEGCSLKVMVKYEILGALLGPFDGEIQHSLVFIDYIVLYFFSMAMPALTCQYFLSVLLIITVSIDLIFSI